jgi:hypothetical protein
MNDVALIHLKYAVERHEDALTEDVKQIKSLKDDLRELLNLMRLLGVFVQRPVSGMEEEKAAIEFDTRLRAMLEKHGVARFEI